MGLYLLKVAPAWLTLKFFSGAVLYVLGAGIWLVILRTYPLSTAFPIAAGALMVGTTAIGYLFLNEQVSWANVAGVAAIFIGITFLAWGGGAIE